MRARWKRAGAASSVAHGGEWIAVGTAGRPNIDIVNASDGTRRDALKLPSVVEVVAALGASSPTTLLALCWWHEGHAEDVMRIETVTFKGLSKGLSKAGQASTGTLSNKSVFQSHSKSRVAAATKHASRVGSVILTETLQWQLGDKATVHFADARGNASAFIDESRRVHLEVGGRSQAAPIDGAVTALALDPSGKQLVVATRASVVLYDL